MTRTFSTTAQQVQVTDAMGVATLSVFDAAGRRTALIENYQPGSGSGISVNKTTQFAYNDDGNMVSLTALNATTGNQVTGWTYGVTTGTGSTINSNALLYQKTYPAASGPVTYKYNRQGQAIGMTDQAGTVHAYSYDLFGRMTSDAVTSFGTGVDMTVQGILRAYEAREMLQLASSLGGGGIVLNQVELLYNDFSQLVTDYQEHNGAVNTSTTPKVGYNYADGTANTVRQTGTTYADGTEVGITYSSAAADALSRPDGMTKESGALCSYAYLGLNVFADVTYTAASNLAWTAETGGAGDAGDPYTAYDRFGRLVETLWQFGGAPQVHSVYGRNRVGGIVWRQDRMASILDVTNQDNYYWYDGLYQVQEHQRGTLNGAYPNYTGITNTQQDETFGYDPTGNWVTYNSLSPANSQTRTQNVANEITQIGGGIGNLNPSYDPVGNMIGAPISPGLSTGQYTLIWDAWNRLVRVLTGGGSSLSSSSSSSSGSSSSSSSSGGSFSSGSSSFSSSSGSGSSSSSGSGGGSSSGGIVASYAYDGLTRRIAINSTQNLYYSKEWQVLELRTGINTSSPYTRYIWGLRGMDDLILRENVTPGSDTQQFFALRDQWNVVAVADATGSVQERYGYDAFGTTLYMDPWFGTIASSAYSWETTFCGYWLDIATGFYQVRYRYLHPGLGRWLSRDPIGERPIRY